MLILVALGKKFQVDSNEYICLQCIMGQSLSEFQENRGKKLLKDFHCIINLHLDHSGHQTNTRWTYFSSNVQCVFEKWSFPLALIQPLHVQIRLFSYYSLNVKCKFVVKMLLKNQYLKFLILKYNIWNVLVTHVQSSIKVTKPQLVHVHGRVNATHSHFAKTGKLPGNSQ